MRGTLRFVFCLCMGCFGATVASAQSKQETTRAAVIAAMDRFPLTDADATWRMKASVQLLQDGKPGETGTVEVLHGAHDDRRTVASFPHFHQVFTATAKGRFYEGDVGDAPAAVDQFLRFLERPVKKSVLENAKLGTGYRTVAGQKFHCVYASSDKPLQTFCTVVGSPAIRYMTLPQSHYSVLIEKMGNFRGGDVPTAAVILFADMPIAHFDLSFSALSSEDAVAIRPAKEAVAVFDKQTPSAARAADKMVFHAAFGSSARLPMVGASALLRLELDSSGKLRSSEIVATSDETLARRVINRLSGQQVALPSAGPGVRFINYSIVIPPRDMESHDDPFYPRAGTNSIYP